MTPALVTHLGAALLAALVVAVLLGVPWWRGRRRERALREREADLRSQLDAARESGGAARRKLEAAFEERREAAERAWQMLDALSVPVWRRDDALRLTACNAAYAEAVEASGAEDAIARNVELRGGSEAAVEAARSLAERARESGETALERTHVVAGGDRLFMELAEKPMPDGSLVGFARDITAEEDLQAELDRHVQGHRDILGMLSNGVAIIGPDLRLDFFNQAYADAFRLDEAFLRARPRLDELLDRVRSQRALPEHSDFSAYIEQHMRKVRTLIEPDEELLHLPDGRTIRRVMYPHPFGGAFMFYEDVTDRLALESSYNTLLAVRQATIEHLQEAVAVIGADGRLKLSNPRFHELWGIPPELAGQEPHVRDLLPYVRPLVGVEDDARWQGLAERIVASATEPAMRSGRREYVNGRVVDWAQVPLPDAASLFTYLDVTDTINVERALRERNEALETADRLKSEFIANVSYELRTPLNAISGFAEMLDGEYFGRLNARQHEHAQGIVRSAQQLSGLINDILDLASIEAGYMELEPSEVSVAAVMESMRKLAGERAQSLRQELSVEYPEDIGHIVADERRLRQALFNLLSNAVNFTPEGGSVTISATGDSADVRFTVSDSGPGISPEAQERLFQPFERGGHGPRRPGAGAGLGLALVKRMVELHGGAVELESAPGTGTTVTCRVPRRPACAAAPAGKPEGERAHGR